MTDLGGDVDRVLADGLARLVESAVRHMAALGRARALTPTDLRALGLVKRSGSMRPGELARALQISASGTTGVIRRRVAAGLVRRDSGPANHRDVRLRAVGPEAEKLRVAESRRPPAARLQAIAAVLDDAAIKWLAAVSSRSDDAVDGGGVVELARTKIWRLASELG
ncbi:MarR family winged helix-turn-helix transcriptional regulator [Baekduia alba]|uniref:MarR family winged helix-turn-helix transcriptional regulator n=1 Tax=Baekduia alba TaxID=2997333 RepID=UPI0023407E49|nr:MarR family transcriptional regulator [Baekduia alba]